MTVSYTTDDHDTQAARATLTHAIFFRVVVSSLPNEEIPSYMARVSESLTDPVLKAQGFIHYFLPVRDGRTSITLVDLRTMASVQV